MKRQDGFTIVELVVTLGIIGILFATAVPIYHTWQQRAYGSEASIMMKQIIDAQILYFLENDKFFPDNETYEIYHSGETKPSGINVTDEIEKNLNIKIPMGHFLDFILTGDNTPEMENFKLYIYSFNGNFDLVKGYNYLWVSLNKSGEVEYYNLY